MTTLDGEDLENFKVLKCFVCDDEIGQYCLTDTFVGITIRCKDCILKGKLK